MIKEVNGRWCLYTKDGSRKLGCHDTEAEAQAQERAVHTDRQRSSLHALAKGYTVRTEIYREREHLVIPVVALVEGVVQAMNARTPEFVSGDEIRAEGWNGRPVFSGHPIEGGEPVSGNTPEWLEEAAIGIVFNAAMRKGKLTMEAWIDKEKATEVVPTLLDRINAREPIEISTGVLVETDDTEGTYNGKEYVGAWHDIIPDHLAILKEHQVGACNRDMGCGVRAAKGAGMAKEKKGTSLLSRVLSVFRTQQASEDMSDNDVKKKILEKLHEKEPEASWVEAVYDDHFIYCSYDKVSGVYPSWMSYYQRDYTIAEDGMATIGATRVEVEPVLYYEPIGAEGETRATRAARGACACQQRSRHNKENEDMTKTERVKALIARAMGVFTDKDQAFLETASDEQLASFETRATEAAETARKATEQRAAADAKAASDAKVKADAEAAAKVGGQPAVPTFESLLAAAPADVRESIEANLRAAKAQKTATIKVLRDSGRCDLTDDALTAKSQAELDALVKLAGIEVKANVDYSGRGGPRDNQPPTEAPAPPDWTAAIKANKGQK